MVGIELRLLQMAWPSGKTPAVSAAATSLLELAASVLPGLSATGRSTAAAAAGALSSSTTALSGAPTANRF